MKMKPGVAWWLLVYLVAAYGVVAPVLSTSEEKGFKPDPRDPYLIHDYTDHYCNRPCEENAAPKICRYNFLIEHYITMSTACHKCSTDHRDCFLPQCVPGDGRKRGILTVNRMLPGPSISVCENDTIEVVVDNRMGLGEATSIHWHGLNMKGTPYMDGVAGVTQCPINTWNKMKYSYKALDKGTHFWHAHSAIQRAEGLFGSLIIRRPKSRDPHGHMYDFDLQEHRIFVTDWVRETAAQLLDNDFRAGVIAQPNSFLINGMGQEKHGPDMPKLVFHVEEGKRYRFRITLNGILSCPVYVSFDSHPVSIIAMDGEDIEPIKVDRFMMVSGERLDFILTASHNSSFNTGNFWIRFKGKARCANVQTFATAVLRYTGAPKTLPPGVLPSYDNTETQTGGTAFNGFSGLSSLTEIRVVDVKSKAPNPDPRLTFDKPDKKHYISLGSSSIPYNRYQPPLPEGPTQKPPTVRPVNQQLNYISSRMPPAPPLTQFDQIPKSMLCNNETVAQDCSEVLCECVHMYSYKLGDLVEFILVSFHKGTIHPMHMHGHTYTVVAMHLFDRPITVKEVREMDARGLIPRLQTPQAPRKDTIAVHPMSATIIRFRAENPGFWFFHCHIEFHTEVGMSMILQEGKVEDLPPPPDGLLSCGVQSSEQVNSTDDLGSNNNPASNAENPTVDPFTVDETAVSGESKSTLKVILPIGMACIVVLGIVVYQLANRSWYVKHNAVYQPLLHADTGYIEL